MKAKHKDVRRVVLDEFKHWMAHHPSRGAMRIFQPRCHVVERSPTVDEPAFKALPTNLGNILLTIYVWSNWSREVYEKGLTRHPRYFPINAVELEDMPAFQVTVLYTRSPSVMHLQEGYMVRTAGGELAYHTSLLAALAERGSKAVNTVLQSVEQYTT